MSGRDHPAAGGAATDTARLGSSGPRRSRAATAGAAVIAVLACGRPPGGNSVDAGTDGGVASVDAAPLPVATAISPGDAGADAGAGAAEGEPAAIRALLAQYKSVLLCGDSQVGYAHGLTRALEARFRSAGATKYYWDAFTSASVQGYDDSDRLPKLLARTKPDIVFISIGSNNVQNPHPEGLAGNVRSLAKKAKAGNPDRACFILGPPLPIKGVKKDTGIVRVLAENSAPCKFFDTSRLALDRQIDRIHPTDAGGEVWADALLRFVATGREP